MEMVMVVLGVLGVMIAIDRQQHERELRLRAYRTRSEQERRRPGARGDA